ncbi:MAG: hypothetical protein V1702_04815 [Candidatus Woesearchaeota archaeon]
MDQIAPKLYHPVTIRYRSIKEERSLGKELHVLCVDGSNVMDVGHIDGSNVMDGVQKPDLSPLAKQLAEYALPESPKLTVYWGRTCPITHVVSGDRIGLVERLNEGRIRELGESLISASQEILKRRRKLPGPPYETTLGKGPKKITTNMNQTAPKLYYPVILSNLPISDEHPRLEKSLRVLYIDGPDVRYAAQTDDLNLDLLAKQLAGYALSGSQKLTDIYLGSNRPISHLVTGDTSWELENFTDNMIKEFEKSLISASREILKRRDEL